VQSANASFALATADKNPHGIADPRPMTTVRKAATKVEASHDAAHALAETKVDRSKSTSTTSVDLSAGIAYLAKSSEHATSSADKRAIDKAFDSLHDALEHHSGRHA
jgi:hypothetical protein